MTRNQLRELLDIAERDGANAALSTFDSDEYEAECETQEMERLAEWECDDRRYRYGCGEYDTVDSRGEKLLPLVNEAGEPWWM